MSVLDRALLAEKVSLVEEHLARVAELLPAGASDGVILHLWLAVQLCIDIAVSACVRLGHGAHADYGDAFRRLEGAGRLDDEIASAMVKACGFRNVVAHAYHRLSLARVFVAATDGPPILRRFLARIRDALPAA